MCLGHHVLANWLAHHLLWFSHTLCCKGEFHGSLFKLFLGWEYTAFFIGHKCLCMLMYLFVAYFEIPWELESRNSSANIINSTIWVDTPVRLSRANAQRTYNIWIRAWCYRQRHHKRGKFIMVKVSIQGISIAWYCFNKCFMIMVIVHYHLRNLVVQGYFWLWKPMSSPTLCWRILVCISQVFELFDA